jgi:hypothetical protein
MSSRLQEVLAGKEANYIIPFFWQHGEEEGVLREEMARIHESGIRAVCVEARPHPDYLGPKWWADIDVILEEAKARGMKVWVLDDDHFPTGHAAGKLKDAPKELRRLFLSEMHVDAIGPRANSAFIVTPNYRSEGDHGELVALTAVKRNSSTGELSDETIDLLAKVEEGKLYWDVPEGCWRIFSLIESDKGGDPKKDDYVNPLVAQSVRVLIDTVHEAFYERYKDEFGHTLAGFFSDEPGFYNDTATFDFDSKLGKKNVSLPWSKETSLQLQQKLGSDYMQLLPLLWHDGGERTAVVRYHYMNIISQLYADHFTAQIGDWCREHGVEYIGHVLEDDNVHTRLACGAGHYYRALGGQDMSGIDVVLWQLKPGFDSVPASWIAGEADSEFYNYGLAKMASSLAHLDPKKKGRTLAEVFGAYGWVEGLKLMKWLTDHMLVRGVNQFVPHAFSPMEFPDPDAPPHMYARGMNPQFRYYRYLNHYTNRMSHLLSGGNHMASAAVLYHAEAEWSGEYMYFHKPVKELMRNQIDCDILPCDAVLNEIVVREGKLCTHIETFDCLIVPYSEALPIEVLKRFLEMAEQGLPIFFVDGFPVRSSEGLEARGLLDRLFANEHVEIVPCEGIAERLKNAGFYEIDVRSSQPYLRYYHIQHSEMDVFMFFNEHPIQLVDTEVYIPVSGRVVQYDAYTNKVKESGSVEEGIGSRIAIQLAPFETIVVLAGAAIQDTWAYDRSTQANREIRFEGPWSVATATSKAYPHFTHWSILNNLTDLSRPELLPSFSGTFRYESPVSCEDVESIAAIDLGEVYETAEVFINGLSAGVRIAAPYHFDLRGLLSKGSNTLAIEVTNTLFNAQPDPFSRMAQLEPSGLLGPVKFIIQ